MSGEGHKPPHYHNLPKVLSAQQRVLAEAGAPRELLYDYRALLRYVSGLSNSEVDRILHSDRTKRSVRQTPDAMSLSEAAGLSLDQIDTLVADDDTARKTLEAIAIGRFQVPKGSMRSFHNINMLKENLRTLVQNERAHRTISSVAQHPRN